jgi:hypothetical protein
MRLTAPSFDLDTLTPHQRYAAMSTSSGQWQVWNLTTDRMVKACRTFTEADRIEYGLNQGEHDWHQWCSDNQPMT